MSNELNSTPTEGEIFLLEQHIRPNIPFLKDAMMSAVVTKAKAMAKGGASKSDVEHIERCRSFYEMLSNVEQERAVS